MGGSATYRYGFPKRGRSISLSATGRYYRNANDEITSQYTFLDEDTDFEPSAAKTFSSQHRDRLAEQGKVSATLNYTEPLSKKSRLVAEYRFDGNFSKGVNMTYLFNKKTEEFSEEADKRQSSLNNTEFLTNAVGLRYSYYFKKISVMANLSYQNVSYKGVFTLPDEDASRKTFHNALYRFIANVPFNQGNTLKIEAHSYTINPGVNTLHNSVNLSNLANIRAGNMDIVPSYFHDVKIRYIHTEKTRGITFSVSANWLNSPNYICDSLVINTPDFEVTDGVLLGEGNQYTKPINLGGYNKFGAKLTFGIPVKFISSNFNLNSSVSVSELPGIINGERRPVHRNWFDLGLRIDSNVSDRLDFSIGYSGRYTMNEFSGKFGKSENNYFSQTAMGRIKCIFWKDLTFTGAVRYVQDINVDGKFNDQFVYCDIFLGKRLFKNRLGEINIGVNDLLNAGVKRFRHTINASGVTDVLNQGIGRTITLQFIYHLRFYNLRKGK